MPSSFASTQSFFYSKDGVETWQVRGWHEAATIKFWKAIARSTNAIVLPQWRMAAGIR
jgi:hypothetical protein